MPVRPARTRRRADTGTGRVVIARRNLVALAVAGAAVLASCEPSAPDPDVQRYDQPSRCDTSSPGLEEMHATSLQVHETSRVGTTWAGMPVGQSLLTTHTQQYVAYYDADRRMTLAQRPLAEDGTAIDGWKQRQVGSTLGWDSHNYVTMAVDRRGALHVAGNMHGDPLDYLRTGDDGDISRIGRVQTMVSEATEQRVTYPVFLRGLDGTVFFYYRDGTSGAGATYMNYYDETTSTWSRAIPGALFDGRDGATDRNAYQTRPVLGPDGRFHMLWVWRDTIDVSTNSRLTYARTEDFNRWEAADGTSLSLPFTYEGGDVVDPIPEGRGLINGLQAVGFDHGGSPVITYEKYDDEGNLQLWGARPSAGGGWSTNQLTHWDNPMTVAGSGTVDLGFDLAAAQPQDDGTLAVDYSCRGTGLTLTLDSALGFVSQQVRRPEYPAELLRITGQEAGLTPRIAEDLGTAHDYEPRRHYVLRWESLSANGDQPRDVWPEEGSTLTVVDLGNAERGVLQPDPQGETS